MRRWAPIAAMAFLLLSQTEGYLVAQSKVTIRAINQIPQKNIRNLVRAGTDLTERDILDLVESPFAGDTISVQAVVLSSPRNSGLSEVVAGRVARVHFFVRDLAAAELGNRGMAIQVIDREYERHGVLDLVVGDVIRLTAVVSEFQNGLFLDPLSVERVETRETLSLGRSILAADSSLAVEDLNRSFGDGTFQARWEMLPRINGSPICLSSAAVEQVQTPSPPDRVDWALTSDGESRMYTYDLSHRFRNDTRLTYPAEFNLRDDAFDPPSPGTIVSVCGFVVLQAFNDPDGVGRPTTSSTGNMFSLIPIGDSDLAIGILPPSIDHVNRPEVVLRSNVGFRVSGLITADPARTIDSALLTYVIGSDTTRKQMSRRSGTDWISVIPPTARDGAFVRYWIRATDSANLEVSSTEFQYRVLDRGIRSISDIQMTHDEGPGPSPFSGSEFPVDIRGVVQSNPGRSGFFSIQDDSLFSPWSGVLLDPAQAQSLGIQRGDRVHITRARIDEVDGVTRLSNFSIGRLVGGDSILGYAPLLTSDLRTTKFAESYEGMMVQLNSAVAVEGFEPGEWSISNSHLADGVRVTSRYSDVADDAMMNWELRPYTRGLWIESGSSWMLALESEADLGEVVNVGVATEETIPLDNWLDQPFPNPAGITTNVSFWTSEVSDVLLEVYDLRGRHVMLLVDETFQAGFYSRSLDVGDLVPGTYLLRMTQRSGSVSRKITIVR